MVNRMSEDTYTLTRSILVERLKERHENLSKQQLRILVDSTFDVISDALIIGDKVKLSGFGKFIPKNKAARVGRNPSTKEALIISRRKVATFQPSQALRAAVANSTLDDANEAADSTQL